MIEFFEPNAVAVVGSMRGVPGTAYWVTKNMQDFGYGGPIYPINPKASSYGSILGRKVYERLLDVPGPVDLAVLIAPPETTPKIIEECSRKGAKAVIILSEGFAETGVAGEQLQMQLVEIARKSGIRMIGPNTFGVVNLANGLVTLAPYVDQDKIEQGNVSFCSQTGSVGPHQVPVGDWRYPVNKMCDIGNKCDVDEIDILNYFGSDPGTNVIAMHLEGIGDGARFIEAARRLAVRKPLVFLKAGRTDAGREASRSHTGSLAGNEVICEGLLRQAGAIRVRTWQELWDVPRTLACQPLPGGRRLAVVSFTGGQGVIAADAASDAGLELARFSADTSFELSRVSARLGRNPVDVGPVMSDSRTQSSSNPFSVLERVLPVVLRDAGVDCLTVSLYAGRQIVPLYPMMTEMLARISREIPKCLTVWVYGTNLFAMEELVRQLQASGLPAYLDLDVAVRCLGYAASYAGVQRRLRERAGWT